MKYKPVKFSVFGFPGVIDKELGSNDRNDTQDTWHGQVSLDVALEEPPHYWCHFLYNNTHDLVINQVSQSYRNDTTHLRKN